MSGTMARANVLGRTLCVGSVAGSLVACGVVVQQAAPALTVEVARIMMAQGGAITIQQALKLTVSVVGPILLDQLTGATGSGGAVTQVGTKAVENDWTIVVRRKVGATVQNTGYKVAYAGKVHVITNGRTIQTFEPSKKLITIDAASDTPTTVAVVDSLEQPTRSSGKFRVLAAGKYTDFDFDTDKRSGSRKGTDLHVTLGGPSGAHGAVYANHSGEGKPTLSDCVTVRPDAWTTDFGKLNMRKPYCVQTSEGRFGTFGISSTGEYSYTMWQTASSLT
ncbi:hypothetical protein OG948_42385 (plasmid) [Embleya sp. NBC_00888]|uniref:hypothetical protein n=1 Tax=Embleya sp. NBC_00888 TaxID=2975960 RepID=UPI00386BE9E7|nr:hypothetical protein OG948_42385 [Embleya sp. NBC_00888]